MMHELQVNVKQSVNLPRAQQIVLYSLGNGFRKPV